jgi:repressor LexA
MGKWAGDKNIFFSRINGDSMNRIMPDQSLIAIKPIEKEALKNGDIVVFSNSNEYSVKYFHKTPDKLIFKPASHNKDHHEQHFALDDGVKIHGKVVLYIVELD